MKYVLKGPQACYAKYINIACLVTMCNTERQNILIIHLTQLFHMYGFFSLFMPMEAPDIWQD